MAQFNGSLALPPAWRPLLDDAWCGEHCQALRAFLKDERQRGAVYPEEPNTFRALHETAPDKVRVVLLGQDPYHGEGQAVGLSFSVPQGVAIPPSLKNVYRELESDLGIPPAAHGNLSAWASRGVLLLNAVLTVRKDAAGSHRNRGWEAFTDTIIERLAGQGSGLVFLLWGNYARQKASLIDASKHLVLTAAHPSPLSARQGFFGSRPFSQTNAWLRKRGEPEIDWRL